MAILHTARQGAMPYNHWHKCCSNARAKSISHDCGFQVNLASVASGLISGLQQGVSQALSTQTQDIGAAVSDAAKVATDAASQQQQAVETVTSALGGLVSGAQDSGSETEGSSPVQQLLQMFQQVTGQAPTSELQSSAIQALRTALNANLLPGTDIQ